MEIFKVLFLDIDDVLNSDDYFNNRPDADDRPYPFGEFDPEAIKRVNRVLDNCDLLVLSSDWRIYPTTKDILIKVGIDTNKVEKMLITPYLGDIFAENLRGHEIDFVVKKLKKRHKKLNYVIIDDLLEFMPFQRIHLVHTFYKNGLTDEKANKAIEMLKDTGLYV